MTNTPTTKILIVEDDRRTRELLYDLLSENHHCHTTSTAELAITLLQHEAYDILLTDISLPGIDGFELLAHTKKSYKTIQVILISGISDEDHIQGAKELGAFDYICKPFKIAEVETTITRALDEAHAASTGAAA